MSHFLFGRISFNSSNPLFHKEKFCSDLNKAGQEVNLYFLFEKEIKQKIVLDMLEEQLGKSGLESTDFLLVDSSVSETSDNLISPFNNEDNLKNFYSKMEDLMSNITSLLQFSAKENVIRSIDLLFTEGYDCEFMQIHSDIKELKPSILNIFKEQEYFVPSLKVSITQER